MNWKLIVKMKEGKNVSNTKLSKRKKEAELTRNVETSLRESKKECLKSLEYWENYKSRKLKERETIILDLNEVELNEEINKEKEKKRKFIRNAKRSLGRNKDFRHITNNVGKGKR